MSARVIQVIETGDRRGLGVRGDPVRIVKQYFTLEGVLLWEAPDEWAESERRTMRFLCNGCGNAVSTNLPSDSILRGIAWCVECIEAGRDRVLPPEKE